MCVQTFLTGVGETNPVIYIYDRLYHKIWLGATACSDPWDLSDDLTWSWDVQWSAKPAPSSIGWSDMELLCTVISESNPFIYKKKMIWLGAGAYSHETDPFTYQITWIDHTVVDSVPYPSSECEAEGDLVLIQTSLTLLSKLPLKNTS